MWFTIGFDVIGARFADAMMDEALYSADFDDPASVCFDAFADPIFDIICITMQSFSRHHHSSPDINLTTSHRLQQLQQNLRTQLVDWRSNHPRLSDAMAWITMSPVSTATAKYLCGLMEVIVSMEYRDHLDDGEFPLSRLASHIATRKVLRGISRERSTFISAEQFVTCVATGDWACLQ